jgi:hypothetical protein
MQIRLMALVLVGAALAAACDVKVGEQGVSVDIANGKASDLWTRSYPITPGGRLEIVNTNGNINLTPGTGSTIEVQATREVRAGSEEAAEAFLRSHQSIQEQAAPDRVALTVSDDAPGERRSGRPRVSVQFLVKIPAGLTVTIQTRNGGIHFNGVDGRFQASTTNGQVTSRDVAGSLSASTVNGNLQLEVTSIRDSMQLHAVNGSIRLRTARTTDADLDLTTVNGIVIAEDELAITASEKSRVRLVGRLNKGGPKITADTTNGAIRLASGDEGQRDRIERLN